MTDSLPFARSHGTWMAWASIVLMMETNMQNLPLSSIVSRRSRNVLWILWVLIFSQYCSVWVIYHQAWLFENISLVLYVWYVWETHVNGFNVLANIRNTCLFKTRDFQSEQTAWILRQSFVLPFHHFSISLDISTPSLFLMKTHLFSALNASILRCVLSELNIIMSQSSSHRRQN